MKHKKIIVVVGIAVLLIMNGVIPGVKNSISTTLHRQEFVTFIETPDFIILKYSQKSARLYSFGTSGTLHEFKKNGTEWEPLSDTTVWSNDGGSTNRFIWPYFYHSATGVLFVGATTAFLIIIIGIWLLFLRLMQDYT